ncbi:MAG: carboxypeptidase regulatory-like domain-containing protein [Planctomycetota bacterium]|nr:carboxypeptidase regulatory-like domain-containing protein [Planctomycetota bacterium]
MGRVLLYGAVLLAAGALTWLLLAEDGPPPSAYGPLADFSDEGGGQASGPKLLGRDGPGPIRVVADGDGDGEIVGHVLTPAGVPLAGVRVTAAAMPAHDFVPARASAQAILSHWSAPTAVPGAVVAEARSAADGSFSLAGLEEHRSFHITADVAPPRYAGSMTMNARADRRWPLRLYVGEGSPLRGQVVDGDGRGLAGYVTLRAVGLAGERPWHQPSWHLPAFATAGDGTFTVPAAPHGQLMADVDIPGRGRRTGIAVRTPTDQTVVLTFDEPDGATIEGKITNSAGQPLGGARVVASSSPEYGTGAAGSSTTRLAVTGDDGLYRVTGLAAGQLHDLQAYAEGYVTSAAYGAQAVLFADRVLRLDIVLVRGVTVRGRVVTAEGSAVAGAEVGAVRSGQSAEGWFTRLGGAVSAADGTYELTNVSLGSGLVQAKLAGFYMPPLDGSTSTPWPWMNNAMQGVPYEADAEGQVIEGIDVVLKPGVKVTGTVVDEAGAPVAAARVVAGKAQQGWNMGLSNPNQAQAVADAAGHFEFDGLEPNLVWSLTATTDSHLSEEPTKLTPSAAGTPVEPVKIVVREGARVAGVVTEGDGQPVAGLTVVIAGSAQASTLTGTDGTFAFTGLKPGAGTVSASGLRPTPPEAQQVVTLVWGKAVEGVALRVPPVLSIHGIVVNDSGKPLIGIAVAATTNVSSTDPNARRRGNQQIAQATTDADGAFELRGLLAGSYRVNAGSASENDVAAGATGIRLVYTVPERVVVEGRVLDADGRPVPRGQVRVWTGPREKRRSQATLPLAGGYFSGRVYTTEAEIDLEVAAAFDAAGQPIAFLQQREKDVPVSTPIELRLDPGTSVSGRVVDEAGGGLAGMQVRVQKKGTQNHNPWGRNQGNGDGGGARSGADGRWSVGGLKEDEYTVELTPGGRWASPEPIPARSGDTDVVITLVPGASLQGRVLTSEGAPLVGAQVWLNETQDSKKRRGVDANRNNWLDSMRLRTQTTGDGRFEVLGLPEGARFDVGASGNGPDMPYVQELNHDIAAGSSGVEFRLSRGVLIEGTLAGPGGESVGNANISVTSISAPSTSTHANFDGRTGVFRIGPVLPGRYKLTAQIHGGKFSAPPEIEVTAPASGIQLVAREAASIKGTLLGGDTRGFMVMFSSGNKAQSAGVHADGSFEVSGVPQGIGTLYAFKRGDDRFARLTGAEPGKGPYRLSLEQGVTIEGRVEGWSGEGSKANVYVQVEGAWVPGVVSNDGTFRISGLIPGTRCTVQAWINGWVVTPASDVEAGSAGVVLKASQQQK